MTSGATDFDAFWLPSDLSNAEALAIAESWLREAEYPGERIVVLNTKEIANSVPEMRRIVDRYPTTSPKATDHPAAGGLVVLAPWVVGDALELAERLASPGGSVLFIDSDPRHPSVTEWLSRTGAIPLNQ
jgi:hypothetical protein